MNIVELWCNRTYSLFATKMIFNKQSFSLSLSLPLHITDLPSFHLTSHRRSQHEMTPAIALYTIQITVKNNNEHNRRCVHRQQMKKKVWIALKNLPTIALLYSLNVLCNYSFTHTKRERKRSARAHSVWWKWFEWIRMKTEYTRLLFVKTVLFSALFSILPFRVSTSFHLSSTFAF